MYELMLLGCLLDEPCLDDTQQIFEARFKTHKECTEEAAKRQLDKIDYVMYIGGKPEDNVTIKVTGYLCRPSTR